MNVLVCVKRVPLTGGKIVLTPDERRIETRHLGFTVSPHEECGVEEAVRIVERHGGASTVITLGPSEAEEQLREALAIGIDRGILLVSDRDDWDAETTTAALLEAIEAERAAGNDPDLIVFGNESADAGNYQVGIRVAHALGRPCVTGLKGLAVEDGRLRCEQEVGSGRDVYLVPLPAVVTVKEGLNLPRYPSVPAKLRARRKPVDRREPAPPAPRLEMVRLTVPAGRGRAAEVLGEGPDGGAGRRRPAAPDRSGMTVLVLVEHAQGELDELSLQALTFARGYAAGDGLDVVVAGPGARDTAGALGGHGVGTVHVAEHDALGEYAPLAWARAVAELVERLAPSAVVAAGSDRGTEVLAHAAVLTGGTLAANCVRAVPGDPAEVTRLRWGGSLLEEARLHGPVKLMTVAPHAVAAEAGGGGRARRSRPSRRRCASRTWSCRCPSGWTRRPGVCRSPRRPSSSRAAAGSARRRASPRSRSWQASWAASWAARAR